jgi:hypothetical protein
MIIPMEAENEVLKVEVEELRVQVEELKKQGYAQLIKPGVASSTMKNISMM